MYPVVGDPLTLDLAPSYVASTAASTDNTFTFWKYALCVCVCVCACEGVCAVCGVRCVPDNCFYNSVTTSCTKREQSRSAA
jgi:hypothetical protein